MLPANAMPERELQVLDDEAGKDKGLDSAVPDAEEDVWVTYFIARLAASVKPSNSQNSRL